MSVWIVRLSIKKYVYRDEEGCERHCLYRSPLTYVGVAPSMSEMDSRVVRPPIRRLAVRCST